MTTSLTNSFFLIHHLDPALLTDHPLNATLYGDKPPEDEFVASVRENGVFDPICCLRDKTVISGRRRRRAAALVGLDSVPVVFIDPMSDEHQVIRIIESNRQREKTVEQKAREYKALAAAKAEIARLRQLASLKQGTVTPVPSHLKERDGGTGEAKVDAANEVGMSINTAEKAAAVVVEIDKAVESGDTAKADELRDTLNNKSVRAAYRLAVPEPDASKADGLLVAIRDAGDAHTSPGVDSKSESLDSDPPEKSRPDFSALDAYPSRLLTKVQDATAYLSQAIACVDGAAGAMNSTGADELRNFIRSIAEIQKAWLRLRSRINAANQPS